VHIVIDAEGETSRDSLRDVESRQADFDELQSVTRKAAAELGAISVRFLGFPDNCCDSIDRLDLTKAIEWVVSELQPHTIYVHYCGDVNIDRHQPARGGTYGLQTATRLPGKVNVELCDSLQHGMDTVR